MNQIRLFQRLTLGLILLLGAAFFLAAYNAINNIVAEQSRLQQEALSPVYQLVREELLKPLYIAETFASSVNFTAALDTQDIDEAALLGHLQKMQRDLDLVFFVASDKLRRQFLSDGSVLELVEGEVSWYFEAIDQDKDIMADLGQVGDVHLYFDVRIYSQDREFIGFVGVGKRIQRFLDTFGEYKAQYGYDFLFVNDRNEIILSSLPELVVSGEYIPKLDSLDWFLQGGFSGRSLNSELIQVDNQDFLISGIDIEELDWQLLLLVPLEARQTQITVSFISNALAAIVFVLLLAGTLFYLMLLYKRGLEKRVEVDLLSGLPNRSYIQRRFDQLRSDSSQLCVILIDLDLFKQINDTYGHNTGDRVIQAVANDLKRGLREMDVVGRWGGEEFVMLIPAASIALGEVVAERARAGLEELSVHEQGQEISVTASFGVAFGSSVDSLSRLLADADVALYQAKKNGRNQVRLHGAA